MKEFYDGDVLEGQYFLKGNKNGLFKSDSGFKFSVLKKDQDHALYGDKVRVELYYPPHKNTLTARVVAVIERTHKEVIGTIDKRKKTCFLIPDFGGVDFHIRSEYRNGVKDGDRVKIRVLEWKRSRKRPEGEVVQIFGQSGNHEAEIQSIISKNQVSQDFPEEVLREAEAISFDLDPQEIAKRRDMRDTFTFTIDPETARDFDDALSFRDLGKGWYEIGVHIADVTHYMRPNSELDKEAFQRATSIYLVDRVIPMLPEKLSNGVCSLRPNEDKFTFSFICEISKFGDVRKKEFVRTVIHSNVRLTYEEAQEMINGEFYDNEIYRAVRSCDEIAKNLKKKRMKEEGLEFKSKQPKFILDDEGEVADIVYEKADDAHELIEDFMLLANRHVSEFLSDRPSIYRCHEEPPEDKLLEIKGFLDRIGYNLDISGGLSTKISINEIMKECEGTPEQNLIRSLLVRTMSKAYYTTVNVGHYGLSFEYYTHFTSPIRRYPDVLVHRLLYEKLSGDRQFKETKLEAKATHCSSKEIYAANAQRESVAFKQAEWISDKIGESFKAVISDIKKWGVYVELIESGCRGLVSKDHLESEGYEVDEENFRLISYDNKKYTLGDVVTVECISVNMQMRLIDFKL